MTGILAGIKVKVSINYIILHRLKCSWACLSIINAPSVAKEICDWLRGLFASSFGYIIEVWFACFMFIKILSAASHIVVAYKTLTSATVSALRTV